MDPTRPDPKGLAKDLESSCVEHDLKIQRQRDEIRVLRAQKKEMGEELMRYKEVYRSIEALPDVQRRQYKEVKSEGHSTGLLICSDWHYAKTFKKKSTQGFNSFGPREAAYRCDILPVNTAKVYKANMGFFGIDKLRVAFLGDHLENMLHGDNAITNSMGPMEEAICVRDHMVSMLEYLYETLRPAEMWVDTTWGGNHGRTTKYMFHNYAHGNSIEWMVFAMVARGIDQKKIPIRWNLVDDYFNTIRVRGHKVRLHHGNEIHYRGGVGGLMVPTNKAVAQWNKAEKVELDIFGHFHQFKEQRDVVTNGSLVGYDTYARSIKADPERPSQSFIVIDKKRGKVLAMEILLT